MRTIIFVLFIACAAAAKAEDAPKPSCGNTIDACQKAWVADEQKLRVAARQINDANNQSATYRNLWINLGDTISKPVPAQ